MVGRMKILTIVPSIHPVQCESMLESFNLTVSKHSDIIINTEIGSITQIYNRIFNDNQDYDFYFLANDDILFKTPLWDLSLAKKGKITYGNDGIQGENLCTFPMIDGNIARTLGWLVLPTLGPKAICGDNVWMVMGQALKILEYVPSIKIQHLWDGIGKQMTAEDMRPFGEWLAVSNRDVEKVRKIL